MSEQCNERIGRGWAYIRCLRSVWRDGKCKTHHPDTLAAKRDLERSEYRSRLIEKKPKGER